MRRSVLSTATVLLAIAVAGSVARAAAPRIISFQGRLADGDGAPVPGSVQVVFRLYDAASGGSEQWSETHAALTPNVEGIFALSLGTTTSLAGVDFGQPLWLQVEIDGETLDPRFALAATPYAMRAVSAESADTSASLGSVTEGDVTSLQTHAAANTTAIAANATDIATNATGIAANVTDIATSVTVIAANTADVAANATDIATNTADITANAADIATNATGVATNVADVATNATGIAANATSIAANAADITATETALSTHAANASAHHTRYTDAEAVSAVGSSFWSLTGNAGTTPGTHYLGTTDSQALELRVAGQKILRLEPSTTADEGPNVIAGSSNNAVGSGVLGATIAGGGDPSRLSMDKANIVSDDYCTIGGGSGNVAGNADASIFATISGGADNTATAPSTTVGGGAGNHATAQYAVVAGGSLNNATSLHSTVAGGRHNTASGEASTVGGGYENEASTGYGNTVSGGLSNTATGAYASIAGGEDNAASGDHSAVSGGWNNGAEGTYSAVPGGRYNFARGECSFAAGFRANANADGTFVWGDSTNTNFIVTNADTFNVRASGGVYLYTNGALTAGMYLGAGGSAWNTHCDRNLKENFVEEDGERILEKISEMPITSWNYKAQDPTVRHIGPVAQDFNAAFGFGEDEFFINTSDLDGVNIAAIKALERRTRELQECNDRLEAQIAELKALIAEQARE